jgi:CBS domain-containing protein
MVRESPVSEWMSTDVVTFHPDENVRDAMRRLVHEDVDAGPVVDSTGTVVGMLSTGDLIVEEVALHFPTVFNFLGVDVQWPSLKHRHLDDDISKALGASVGEVMNDEPVVVAPDDTVEVAATVMHDNQVSRVPVVDGGSLVGLLSRNDILRAVISEEDGEGEGAASGEG